MSARGCAIERRLVGNTLEIKVRGIIDEHADLRELANLTHDAVIDLGGVERINSFGVRLWITTFRQKEHRVRVSLTRCPAVMVDQANLISRFFGDAAIVSFYVPIRCDDCDVEGTYLARPQDVIDMKKLRFDAACKRCNGPLEVDEWEEHYFRFLADLNAPSPA